MSTDERQWMQGHLLYLKPEYRGRDLACHAYFPAVLDLCRATGAKGFRFLSTLERWKRSSIFSYEQYFRQKGGPDVVAYWKAVR